VSKTTSCYSARPSARLRALVVGVISDTHGLLRPEALAALRGADRILHAGDIGGPEILESLEKIAPVTAVRGNNDTAPWARALPETAKVCFGAVDILVVHDVNARRPARKVRRPAHVVVSGHSHRPRSEWIDGVLYFNPGSAGPRRFTLPISVGRLFIDPSASPALRAEIVELPTR
jgi:putative phosphoesterase